MFEQLLNLGDLRTEVQHLGIPIFRIGDRTINIYPFDTRPIFAHSYETIPGSDRESSKHFPSYDELDEERKTIALDGYFKKKGLDIHYVPYSELYGKYGDVRAYRIGDRTEIGTDYAGRPIGPAEMRALLAHEGLAGHDHRKSDAEIQKEVEAFLYSLGDKSALEEAKRISREILN